MFPRKQAIQDRNQSIHEISPEFLNIMLATLLIHTKLTLRVYFLPSSLSCISPSTVVVDVSLLLAGWDSTSLQRLFQHPKDSIAHDDRTSSLAPERLTQSKSSKQTSSSFCTRMIRHLCPQCSAHSENYCIPHLNFNCDLPVPTKLINQAIELLITAPV